MSSAKMNELRVLDAGEVLGDLSSDRSGNAGTMPPPSAAAAASPRSTKSDATASLLTPREQAKQLAARGRVPPRVKQGSLLYEHEGSDDEDDGDGVDPAALRQDPFHRWHVERAEWRQKPEGYVRPPKRPFDRKACQRIIDFQGSESRQPLSDMVRVYVDAWKEDGSYDPGCFNGLCNCFGIFQKPSYH